jgi:predicted transcriptional regulator
MNTSRRRSNIEIIAEMLKVGENGAGKTRIMYGANMSYSQIQKYLGFLMNRGFIDRVKVGNPSVTYRVTDSGLKLLESITGVIDMLGWEDEEKI